MPPTDAAVLATRSSESHPWLRKPLTDAIIGAIPRLRGLSLHDFAAMFSGALSALESQLSAAEALRVVRAVRDVIKVHEGALSDQVIASESGKSGSYDGFTIVESKARATFGADAVSALREHHRELYDAFRIETIDTKALAAAQPEVFASLATYGSPTISVKLT